MPSFASAECGRAKPRVDDDDATGGLRALDIGRRVAIVVTYVEEQCLDSAPRLNIVTSSSATQHDAPK